MLQIPELLAPAGDLERLRYAINYGADAVYCGLPEFGMRSAPANFTPEQLAELRRVAPGMLEEWRRTRRAPRHAAWLHQSPVGK